MNTLIDELLNGADLNKLVDLAAEFLNSPIMLSGTNGIPLVTSKNYPNDVFSDILNNRKRIPITERELNSSKYIEVINDGNPHITYWPYVRNNNMLCGCIINNNLEGGISIPDTNISLDEIDIEDVKFVSKVFATALVINRSSHLKKFNGGQQYLWALISENIPASYLENNVVWNVFNYITTYKLLWYIPIDLNGNTISDSVILQIDSKSKNMWRISFENGFVIITDGNDKKVFQSINDLAKKSGLLISSSEEFTDIKKTKEQFRLSQLVFQFAKKFGKSPGLAEYNDYKIHHLLSLATNQINANDLKHDALKYIKIYDNENHSEYGLTLRTYLICNMNIQETADKLCIHKNTLIYRVKRLRELFNINFDDLKEVTTLYYSILM